MKHITEIQPNVDRIELDGKTIYLIGTAHVSESSAALVEQVIREVQPEVVCVELCAPRLESLNQPERWREMDIFQVIRGGKGYVVFAQLVLAAFQKRLAKNLGVKPGEEMRRACSAAEQVGAKIAVIDRDIRITLKRAWASASLFSVAKIITALIGSVFSREEISEAEIERLKGEDALTSLLSEFSDVLPEVTTVLIDERDRYMSGKIGEQNAKTIVAVVGAGHVRGMKEAIGQQISLAELEEIPPPRAWLRIVNLALPALIIAMIGYGFVSAGAGFSMQLVGTWVLYTGCLAAIGAVVALSHPLTVITAFVVAPLTTLHPAIAAGWVCGIVEAVLRKPRVRDLETISDDMCSIRGVWSNRFSKVLLVMVFANLGSALGAVLGSVKLAYLIS